MTTPITEALAALNARLDGRAAGLWVCAGETLRLVAFQPALDLPDAVREGFVSATREVPLSRRALSIAQACAEGTPVLSMAEALPPETGSGYCLRAFGAACSLAVPIAGTGAYPGGVLSVATRAVPASPEEVAALLRATGAAMLGP